MDYFSFAGMRFPYKRREESVPGKVRIAMRDFSKWRYDHTVLFHSYCDLIGVTEKGLTLYQDVKYKKGIIVQGGVSIDETLLEKDVWSIKKVPADQLISILFYSGGKNRYAFESGFLTPMILGWEAENTFILNPSPYIIQDTIEKCKGYIVWDDFFKKAYSYRFKNGVFFSYSEIEKLEENSRTVALLADEQDVQTMSQMLQSGNFEEIVVSIPHTLFKKCRKKLLDLTDKTGLNLQAVLLVDTKVLPSNPKKHMILYFDRQKPRNPIPVRVLSLSGTEMVVGEEEYSISNTYIQTGLMTIRDVQRLNEIPADKKQRKRPEEYRFSPEIRIQVKYRYRDEKKNAIVSYNSIPDERGKTKKLSKNIEKGLQYTDEKDLKDRLDLAVFYDELYLIIKENVEQYYFGRYEILSLKTLWYLCRGLLLNDKSYDESLLWEIFVKQENELQTMKYEDLFTEKKADIIDQILKGRSNSEKKGYIVQLNLLLDLLIKEKVFQYNPFRELLANLSNRMSEEQYEVRNALAKRNLSIGEQRQLLKNTCRADDWLESEAFHTLVICFRLLSGIPVREMLALVWSDMIENTDYGFYQVQVTMMIDREGQSRIYGTQDDWRRFRLIPIVPELARLLHKRKRIWMKKYNLTDKEIASVPIFCETYDHRRKKQQIMPYETINKICREAIAGLNIQKLEVNLPGEKELITDLSKYYNDLFLSNFRFHANHTCKMNRGEINYLLGLQQEDTYAEHYCDYTNDAVQFQMLHKLIRWSVLLKNVNGLSDGSITARVRCEEYHIQIDGERALQIKLHCQFGGTARLRKVGKERNEEE